MSQSSRTWSSTLLSGVLPATSSCEIHPRKQGVSALSTVWRRFGALEAKRVGRDRRSSPSRFFAASILGCARACRASHASSVSAWTDVLRALAMLSRSLIPERIRVFAEADKLATGGMAGDGTDDASGRAEIVGAPLVEGCGEALGPDLPSHAGRSVSPSTARNRARVMARRLPVVSVEVFEMRRIVPRFSLRGGAHRRAPT